MPLSKQEIEAFLKEPNVAVVATVTPGGSPHAVPTWYQYDAGEIVLHMGPNSKRYGNMKRNDRVAVCVDTRIAPYKAVIIRGRVRMEETRYEGPDGERMRETAIRYLGETAGNLYADSIKGQPTVIARLTPEHVTSWDYGRRDNP